MIDCQSSDGVSMAATKSTPLNENTTTTKIIIVSHAYSSQQERLHAVIDGPPLCATLSVGLISTARIFGRIPKNHSAH